MMRISKLTTALALFLALSASANAQFQRMALAIGEYVARAGADALISAYCIDPEREAPRNNTVFSHDYGSPGAVQVEYQGRAYSPQEASAAGIGDFVGRGVLGVVFRPKVASDVRIKVNDVSIFSDRADPPSQDHIDVVAPILKSAPKEAPRDTYQHYKIQDSIWNAVEIRHGQIILRDLGFDVGEIDGVAGPKYRAAVRQASKLFPDEPWSQFPTHALVDIAITSKRPLSPKTQQTVREIMTHRLAAVGFEGEEAPSAFAKYHGIAAGEVSNPTLIEKLKLDEETRDALIDPFDTSAVRPIAVERTATGDAYLVNAQGPEAWVFGHQGDISRARGASAIALLDKQSAEAASLASVGGALFLYASRSRASGQAPIRLQVGMSVLTPPQSQLNDFLSGRSDLPGLSNAIKSTGKGHGDRPSLFVYRGALERFEAEVQEAGFGDDVPPPAIDTVRFTADLRRRLAGMVDVYLASDTYLAQGNALIQPEIRKSSDLAVFKGEEIQDWGAIDDLANAFRQANIHVAVDDLGTIKAENVIIFTGHRDANLFEYLSRLSNDGDLDNKLVVLFSCHAASCEIGQSKVLQSTPDGPSGIVYFPDQINSTAVTLVLKELAVIVKAGKIKATNITDLIDQSINNAVVKARPELRPEIEKLRRMIIQVSELLDDSALHERKA
jgi:hypothetical protein